MRPRSRSEPSFPSDGGERGRERLARARAARARSCCARAPRRGAADARAREEDVLDWRGRASKLLPRARRSRARVREPAGTRDRQARIGGRRAPRAATLRRLGRPRRTTPSRGGGDDERRARDESTKSARQPRAPLTGTDGAHNVRQAAWRQRRLSLVALARALAKRRARARGATARCGPPRCACSSLLAGDPRAPLDHAKRETRRLGCVTRRRGGRVVRRRPRHGAAARAHALRAAARRPPRGAPAAQLGARGEQRAARARRRGRARRRKMDDARRARRRLRARGRLEPEDGCAFACALWRVRTAARDAGCARTRSASSGCAARAPTRLGSTACASAGSSSTASPCSTSRRATAATWASPRPRPRPSAALGCSRTAPARARARRSCRPRHRRPAARSRGVSRRRGRAPTAARRPFGIERPTAPARLRRGCRTLEPPRARKRRRAAARVRRRLQRGCAAGATLGVAGLACSTPCGCAGCTPRRSARFDVFAEVERFARRCAAVALREARDTERAGVVVLTDEGTGGVELARVRGDSAVALAVAPAAAAENDMPTTFRSPRPRCTRPPARCPQPERRRACQRRPRPPPAHHP